jgi:WD40 repeat protein/energy-coupling factor transporter ATP-binding protein EcfA2
MTKKSPFKFLDSFTKDDRDIFFGRDKEIEELHTRVFESKILLVYGTSGTGKSSLINCGLANRFSDSDWLPVDIRRGTDINRSLFEALFKSSLTRSLFEKINASGSSKYNLEKLLRSVYLDHFRPVFLIFDQFEELFIFGSPEERQELIKNVAKVVNSDIQCRFIFSMREEYLAGVTEFEKEIPSFLSNRIRIEKMTRQNAVETIEGPCRINNIQVEAGFAEALLEKLNPDTPEVELTWLQIFLDKIMKLAEDEYHEVNKFTLGLIDKAGEVKDILGTFLEEQISQLSDAEAGLVVLKSFVSVKGTKHQITEEEVIEYSGTFGREIDSETVKELIQRFIRLRILRDKSEDGKYELRHDSLASKIYEKITIVEKELLEVKYFIENAYSNYVKRGLLLSDEDLKYIAPYEDKLFLNEKSLKFIAESKQAIHRARRRKLNIAIAAVSIIIVILSLFSIWAMRSRKNAIILRQMAMEQKDAAVRSKVEADSAKQVALLSQLQAEKNAKLAMAARNQSEAARKEALAARGNALQQKSIAEKMSAVASEQAKKAEEEKQIAEQQKILAQAAEEKAKRLSLLSTAQNLALVSMSLERKPEIMGLLAVQAYNFHISNGGAVEDPVIYKALERAFSVLDKSKHSVFKGSANEIISLAEYQNTILGADIDGNLFSWNNDGNSTVVPNSSPSFFINFIRLSPDGKKLLAGFENDQLILRDLTNNDKDIRLKGHKGSVRAASWNDDSNYLATGGNDSLIIIWNDSAPVKILKANSAIRDLTFCGRDSIASVNEDGSIYIWDLKSSSNELIYPSSDEKALCLAYDKLRGNLLAGSSEGIIFGFALRHKTQYYGRYPSHTTGIDHLVFNNDFSMVASSAWDKTIRLYNYHEFFQLHDFVKGVKNIENLDSRTRALIFTSDNKLFAGMSDKNIRLWETSSPMLASMLCRIINRDMLPAEWEDHIGSEIPYEKTCGSNSKQ